MMKLEWSELTSLLKEAAVNAPKIGLVLLVIIVGLAAAFLIRFLISKGLELLRFNMLCDRIGFSEFLRKGLVAYTPSRLMGVISFWLVFIFTLFAAADLARIAVLGPVFARIGSGLPKLLTAVILFIAGYAIVSFLANFVSTIANNAAFAHARLLSQGVKALGILFVLILSLDNLQINSRVIGQTFLILLAAASFGVALAFGLGAKEIARDILEKARRNLSERGNEKGDMEG